MMRWVKDGYSAWHAVLAERPLCTQSYDTTRAEPELPIGATACSFCVRGLVEAYEQICDDAYGTPAK